MISIFRVELRKMSIETGGSGSLIGQAPFFSNSPEIVAKFINENSTLVQDLYVYEHKTDINSVGKGELQNHLDSLINMTEFLH